MTQPGDDTNSESNGDGAGEKTPPVLRNRVAYQGSLDLEPDAKEPECVDEEETVAGEQRVSRFDLFDNRFTVITLVILAGMMTYGVVDALPLGETYVAGYPYLLFAAVGLVAAVLVGALNVVGRVPSGITAGLAMVAGVVAMAVAHPGLLRVNAMMDDGGSEPVEFVRVYGNRFEPASGNWPGIDMIGGEYWDTLSGQVRRRIPMRRGGLGFYQGDLTAIRFEIEVQEAEGG